MTDNLPPIHEGYELVPKEEYGTLRKTTGVMFCYLGEDAYTQWQALGCVDHPILGPAFRDEIKYIRPVKTVATSPSTKPPLGLCPRNSWLSGRVKSIKEAMARYACAKKDIPYAWVEELFDLETDMSFGKEQP